jgi:hypothetical protein
MSELLEPHFPIAVAILGVPLIGCFYLYIWDEERKNKRE